MDARLKRWLNGYVILCEIIGYKEQSINYSIDENEEIKFNIKYWMNELLKPLGNSISFFQQMENENVVVVSVVKINEEISLNDNKSIEKFYELIENVNIEYKLELVIGISNLSSNIRENVKTAYEQARIASSYKFYYQNSKVLEYFSIEDSFKTQQFKRLKEEDTLMEAFIKIDEAKTINIMNQIIENMIIKEVPHPQYLVDKVINIILKLAEAMQTKMDDEDYYKLILNIKEEVLNCSKFINVKEKSEELLINLIRLQKVNKSNLNKNNRIMKKCIEYIDINYKEQISLEKVAEEFYFNTSYFSSYFKNNTGVNFSQYLLRLRMKKSKELLQNTNLKVYEIATQVGYLDPKYFNRLFKNEFGISPEEYRRAILGGKNRGREL